MQGDEAAQLVGYLKGHQWPGVAFIVIGLVVRLLKSDTRIPITVKPEHRAYLAFGLGIASGVLQKVVQENVDWTTALVGGVCSAALAAFAHDGIISSARGGRELAIPGVVVPGVPPGPGKPVSIAPPEEPSVAPVSVPKYKRLSVPDEEETKS